MESILVVPRNEQEYSLVMQMLEKMRITATPMREERVFKRMTLEEYREEINRSIEDVKAGRVISQEEMKRQMAQW
jgi:hypothetical protein